MSEQTPKLSEKAIEAALKVYNEKLNGYSQRTAMRKAFAAAMQNTAPDPIGRVIVFHDPDEPDGNIIRVFAVPGDWDGDDVERFVLNESEGWDFASVTNIEPIPAKYL